MEPELFCLDDTCFAGLFDDSANISANIDALTDVAEQIISDGQLIAVSSRIDEMEIGNNQFFYDLYSVDFSNSDKSGELDRDTIVRLLALRRKLDTRNCTVNLPIALYSSFSGECVRDTRNSGVAEIIAQEIAAPEGARCFALLLVGRSEPESGEYHLHINGQQSNKVYALHSLNDLMLYARWKILNISQSEVDFFSVWDSAFPLLLKSDNLTFKRFEGNYLALHKDVLGHLAFLNDNFRQIWDSCGANFVCFQRTSKTHGVELSNEGDNTRKNSGKMQQRVARFSGRDVVCELHTKLSWNRNRIHFHPPIEALNRESVLIGIFVDHLEV
jgi:hypothetical protein